MQKLTQTNNNLPTNRKGWGDDMNFNLQEMIMFIFLLFQT